MLFMLIIGVLAICLTITLIVIYKLWKEWSRTATLQSIGLRLNSTIKRKELLQIIMETTAESVGAEGSSIILIDEESGDLYFEVATGNKNQEVKEIRLRAGEGIAGWVASTGQSVLIADAVKDSRWSNRVSTKVNIPTRNLMCVPIISNDKTLGVLQVINRMGRRSFNRRDLALLEMIASPTAIALENMLLYEALIKSMENLRITTAAKERMESELKIAEDIQRSFLPGDATELGRVKLHACLIPARVVGGDFYHFIQLDDHKLLVCLGDVSDKGMPAALFMSALMIWIQAKANADRSPAEIIQHINREVSTEESTMFATLFLAIIDTRTGKLRYCDAGHCSPYIVSHNRVSALKTKKNLPVGVFADANYEVSEMMLQSGESLVLYTDGITESENAHGEWFTESRLQHVLEQTKGRSPLDVTTLLQEQVFAFVDGNAQFDDIAIMTVQFN